jgi:hypothetical protein
VKGGMNWDRVRQQNRAHAFGTEDAREGLKAPIDRHGKRVKNPPLIVTIRCRCGRVANAAIPAKAKRATFRCRRCGARQ